MSVSMYSWRTKVTKLSGPLAPIKINLVDCQSAGAEMARESADQLTDVDAAVTMLLTH